MKIIVMSDSHGNDEVVAKIIKDNPNTDYFLHCGDLCSEYTNFPDVIFVRGNNEYDYSIPNERVVNFNGFKIGMTHSHRFPSYVREDKLADFGVDNDCKIVVFGHTHCICDTTKRGVRLLNPGSLFYNRDGNEIGYYVININSKNDYTVRFVKFK